MSDAELISQECEKVKSLLLEKNKNYGGSALEPKRIFSKSDSVEQIKVRIDDKLSRIQTLGIDSLQSEDTLLDLIGYLILLRIANAKKVGTSVPLDELKARWEETKELSKMIKDIPKAIPYTDKVAEAKFIRNLEKQFEEQILTAPSPSTVAEMEKNYLEMENCLGTDEKIAEVSEAIQKTAPHQSRVNDMKVRWHAQMALRDEEYKLHEQREREAALELKEKKDKLSEMKTLLGTDEDIARTLEDIQKIAPYVAEVAKAKVRRAFQLEKVAKDARLKAFIEEEKKNKELLQSLSSEKGAFPAELKKIEHLFKPGERERSLLELKHENKTDDSPDPKEVEISEDDQFPLLNAQTEDFAKDLEFVLSQEQQEDRKQEHEKTLFLLAKIAPLIRAPKQNKLSELKKGIIIRRPQVVKEKSPKDSLELEK